MLLWVGRRRCWSQAQAPHTKMHQLKASVRSIIWKTVVLAGHVYQHSTGYFSHVVLPRSAQLAAAMMQRMHQTKSQSLPLMQTRPGMTGLRMHSHVHRTATDRCDDRPDHSPVGALAHALQMQDCPTVMRPASRNVLAPRSSAVAKTSRSARGAPHPASGVKEHNCLLEALCSFG